MDIHEIKEKDAAVMIGNVTVLEEKKRKFQCDICLRTLQSEKSLIRHKRHFHEPHKHSFKCDQCDFTCAENAQLKTHIISKHIKATKYPCDECSYVTNILSQLTNHVKYKHSDGSYKVNCNICGKTYSAKSILADHMLHEHDIVFN